MSYAGSHWMRVIFSQSTEKRLTSFLFCIRVIEYRETQTHISVVRHLLFYNTNITWLLCLGIFSSWKDVNVRVFITAQRHVSNVLFVKYKRTLQKSVTALLLNGSADCNNKMQYILQFVSQQNCRANCIVRLCQQRLYSQYRCISLRMRFDFIHKT